MRILNRIIVSNYKNKSISYQGFKFYYNINNKYMGENYILGFSFQYKGGIFIISLIKKR